MKRMIGLFITLSTVSIHARTVNVPPRANKQGDPAGRSRSQPGKETSTASIGEWYAQMADGYRVP
jgi:hypothetical protein